MEDEKCECQGSIEHLTIGVDDNRVSLAGILLMPDEARRIGEALIDASFEADRNGREGTMRVLANMIKNKRRNATSD